MIRSYFIIVLLTVLGRILGLLREILIASRFGASADYDAYIVANILPDLINVIMSIAVGSALIPVIVKNKKTENLDATIHSMVSFILCFLVVAACLGGLFSNSLIELLSPGLNEYSMKLSADLVKYTMPLIILSGVMNVSVASLHAENKFFLPALQPIILNVFIIISIIMLFQRYGIYCMISGLYASFLIQIFLQFSNRNGRTVFRNLTKLYSVKVEKINEFSGVVVIIGIYIVIFLNSATINYFASMLPTGSISLANYATRLSSMVMSFTILPLTTVLFPKIAENAAVKDFFKITQDLKVYIRFCMFFIIPFVVVFMIHRTIIIEFLFLRGNISTSNISVISSLILLYSGWMLFQPVYIYLLRVSHALKLNYKIFFIVCYSWIFNVFYTYYLMKIFGLTGVIAATSLQTIIVTILTVKLVSSNIDFKILLYVVRHMAKPFLFSLASGIFSYVILNSVILKNVHYLSVLLLSVSVFWLSYFLFTFFSKQREMLYLCSQFVILKDKLFKSLYGL